MVFRILIQDAPKLLYEKNKINVDQPLYTAME